MTQPAMLRSAINNVAPKQAIKVMWIVWAALLLGEWMFLGVVALLLTQDRRPGAPTLPLLVVVNLVMLLTAVPVLFLVRRMIQQRYRRPDGTVPPGPYLAGGIIFWGGCEGVAFFGLVVAMVNRSLWPTILMVAVAMVLQVAARPKLAAMEVAQNPYEAK
jgi:hypothetical protein